MRLKILLFVMTALLSVVLVSAKANELVRGQTTDWAEHKFVAQDANGLCVWIKRSFYCPRNNIPLVVQSRRVMDKVMVKKLQRLQRANRPVLGQLNADVKVTSAN